MHLNPTITIVVKLLVAAALGGVVGLERDLHHKPAGLRTNIFICLGSALFTILSEEMAHRFGDASATRIASNLIPGIGFIGAGAILRERGSVVGLTSAATIFVMAGVGMAVGTGLYAVAAFTALLALLSLTVLGWAEDRFGLKSRLMTFRMTTAHVEEMLTRAQEILNETKVQMQHFQVFRVGSEFLLEFDADVTLHQQHCLAAKLGSTGARLEIAPVDAPRE